MRCALLLLALAACRSEPQARAPGRTELPAAGCTVPIRLAGGLPVVRASVDDGPQRNFLLDTGTDRMLLDPRRVTTRAPIAQGAGSVQTADGSAAALLGTTTVATLQLGAATFRDLPAAFLDLAPLSAALGRRIDGILGCDLFAGCIAVLDGPGRRLRLCQDLPADLPPLLAEGRLVDPVPWLACRLGDQPVRCLLDTCFQRLLAVPPTLPGLIWREPPQADGELVTLGGTSGRQRGQLRGEFACGELRLVDPWLTVAPGSAKVGAELLQQLVLVLDRPAGRFALHWP